MGGPGKRKIGECITCAKKPVSILTLWMIISVLVYGVNRLPLQILGIGHNPHRRPPEVLPPGYHRVVWVNGDEYIEEVIYRGR